MSSKPTSQSAVLARVSSRSTTGIGEFTIHKEFVSSKVAGDIASLTDPALDRILEFAGEPTEGRYVERSGRATERISVDLKFEIIQRESA